MKISVTTDDGEVVAILNDNDVGDLDKPLPRADLIQEIRVYVQAARKMDRARAAAKNQSEGLDNGGRKS